MRVYHALRGEPPGPGHPERWRETCVPGATTTETPPAALGRSLASLTPEAGRGRSAWPVGVPGRRARSDWVAGSACRVGGAGTAGPGRRGRAAGAAQRSGRRGGVRDGLVDDRGPVVRRAVLVLASIGRRSKPAPVERGGDQGDEEEHGELLHCRDNRGSRRHDRGSRRHDRGFRRHDRGSRRHDRGSRRHDRGSRRHDRGFRRHDREVILTGTGVDRSRRSWDHCAVQFLAELLLT